MRKTNGFTLIEILVALMIFAIIGVLAARSLQSIIQLHHQIKQENQKITRLMIGMTLIRRDIENAIYQQVRQGDASDENAFVGSKTQLLFMRTGLLNPFATLRQSSIETVEYLLQGNHLVRLSFNLNAINTAQPTKQILFDHIQSIHWQYISSDGKTSFVWPMSKQKNALQTIAPDPLPRVVLMVVKLEDHRTIEGVFPIGARGMDIYATNP